MTGRVRVAICEDSRAYAAGLKRFLEADAELEIVFVAPDAETLLAGLAAARADLVTMDLELPGMHGTEAITLLAALPEPPAVVVLSAHVGLDGAAVARALAAGALEAIPKRVVRLDTLDDPRSTALRRRLVRLARAWPDGRRGAAASAHARRPGPAPVERAAGTREPSLETVAIVGIGASTGGPGALREVLGALPADFPVPIVVVQHMSEGFLEGLVAWLDDVLALPVRLAVDGERPRPGVAVAPEGAHLVLTAARTLALDRRTAATPHRPSVDMLLSSLAAHAGRRSVGVVLTGMGHDGADGVRAIHAAGGLALTQTPGDAALWSMPEAARDAGARAVPLTSLGPLLAGLRRER